MTAGVIAALERSQRRGQKRWQDSSIGEPGAPETRCGVMDFVRASCAQPAARISGRVGEVLV
ncbi:hypothetical protein [Nocardia sp. NPDC005998]|uniref:hypothetical protein n=1 Tax=Nocardia sp. NPDC005998 TaxID=3156894 RepID=UPI0033A64026